MQMYSWSSSQYAFAEHENRLGVLAVMLQGVRGPFPFALILKMVVKPNSMTHCPRPPRAIYRKLKTRSVLELDHKGLCHSSGYLYTVFCAAVTLMAIPGALTKHKLLNVGLTGNSAQLCFHSASECYNGRLAVCLKNRSLIPEVLDPICCGCDGVLVLGALAEART